MTIPASVGRYRITGELGRGAMGVVYRGSDPALERTVAIKVIRLGAADSVVPPEELEARFLREAKVAARILHPNVVTVFDVGREGHALYIVMELIEGESLAARMARGAFPGTAEALEIVARVADALAAAHALGVVHRDVKPANIMLTRDGGVKVADFGVAKAIGEGTDLTRTGTVVGSPAYMAPEQVRGEPIDGRADLFSLGVVLYELIVRRKPFPADTVTTLIYQILNEDPFKDPSLTAPLGPQLEEFLRQCLAKDPAARIGDAATFAARARAVLATLTAATLDATGPTRILPQLATSTAADARSTPTVELPPVAAPATAPPAAKAAERRLPWLPLALLAAGLVLVVAAAVMLLRPAERPPAGEALLGEATPLPLDTAPAAPSPTPAPAEANVLVMVTPLPTLAPTVVPTAIPQTVPPVPSVVPTVVATRFVPPPTPTPPIAAVFVCSEGAKFKVSPEEAEVTIDGKLIGIADDWDGMGGGQTYMFPGPGTYWVMLALPGYQTTWVKIEVRPDAKERIVDVDTDLPEEPGKKKSSKDETP